jgi:hypothetical protein
VGLEVKLTFAIDATDSEGAAVAEFIRSTIGAARFEHFFGEWFLVSQVELVDQSEGLEQTGLPWLFARVERAPGVKCPRCWKYSQTTHADELCLRCEKIV